MLYRFCGTELFSDKQHDNHNELHKLYFFNIYSTIKEVDYK